MILPLLLLFCVSILTLTGSVEATWRMKFTGTLSIERLDPIVNPGTIAGHVHNIAGGQNLSPVSTFDTMRMSRCTNCPVLQDLSGYWTPQLYYQYPDGTFISVPGVYKPLTIYYRHHDPAKPIEKPFPKGFRMIAGDTNLRSYDPNSMAQKAIQFVCLDEDNPDASLFTPYMPNKTCVNGLKVVVTFPTCWDGINLDSEDHRSHVAYPSRTSGLCLDPKFPVQLMQIRYKQTYDVGKFAKMWYSTQSPFVFANGDPTGYGMHADFINGWDQDVLTTAISNCTDPKLVMDLAACSVFDVKLTNTCTKKASFSEVVVDTRLASLPGCNPVWNGTGIRPTCLASASSRSISIATSSKISSTTNAGRAGFRPQPTSLIQSVRAGRVGFTMQAIHATAAPATASTATT